MDALGRHARGAIRHRNDATGTIVENYKLKYKGTSYTCSSGTTTWTASLQS